MSSLVRRTLEWMFVIVTVTALVRYHPLLPLTSQSSLPPNNVGDRELAMTSSVDVVTVSPYPSEIPQYIVDQARKRAKQFNATVAVEEVRILVDNHPAFRDIPQQYQPQQLWKQLYFPDVSIAGLQKAGSSQLYNILTSHSDMFKFHSEKEFSFGIPHLSMDVSELLLLSQEGDPDVTRRNQVSFIQSYFHGRFISKGFEALTKTSTTSTTFPPSKKLSVNACLDTITSMMMRQYLDRTTNSKVIFMVRDPADWLWSSYNFMTFPKHIDLLSTNMNSRATAPEQYRSPELFHEMLLAGSDRFGPTAELIGVLRDRINNLFSRVIAAAAAADKENNNIASNILVVKTEDMKPDRIQSSGFIAKLADFLGVSIDGFDASVLQSFSNCGNSHGTHDRCSKASAAYAVAGNRSMLEQSRDLIYLYFAEECKLWAEEFGVVYERCLQVSDQYQVYDSDKSV
jgi:hypothetical protein